MKYCQEMTDRLCEHLATGLNRRDSCLIENISFETFSQWMKKSAFSDAVKKAESSNKQYHIDIIKKAAQKNWTASAWWLERKFPEEFALKNKVEANVKIKIEGLDEILKKVYPDETK